MTEADKAGLIHYSSTGLASQKRYLDEMHGQPVDTVWDDIRPVQAQAEERLGYPTQKPEALLERILGFRAFFTSVQRRDSRNGGCSSRIQRA